MNLELPEKWNDWNLTEFLGEGSYGEVYKAENSEGEVCAIKVIEIPKTKEEAEQVRREYGDEETVKSFYTNLAEDYEKEIELLNSLKNAENIVRVHDYIREPNGVGWKLFIRMELLENFTEYCDVHEITEERILQFGLDICSALEQCESLGIVHRDLKPDNILVDENGTLKLGDFGLARTMEASNGSYSIKGTFSYMAPELYFGRKYSRQVDIYSLGIILYRLLNRGREPFVPVDKKLVYYKDKETALNRRMNGEKLPDPVDASTEMAAIIQKACAYKLEDRYKSASEMKRDLLKLQRGMYRKSLLTHSQKKRIGLTAAAVILVIAVCGGVIWLQMMTGLHTKLSDDGVLTVYGNKPVTNDEVAKYKEEAKRIVIKEGIPAIRKDCFSEFEYVQSVEIPESVTSISDGAFINCFALKTADLSKTKVTSIGSYAFSNCTALESIDLPPGLTKNEEGTFMGCESLKSIVIPDLTVSIGDEAFELCRSLKSVKLGRNTRILGYASFEACDSLEEVAGIESVTTFAAKVFTDSKWAQNVADDEGFLVVNGVLLSYLGKAKAVRIPERVHTIGTEAFMNADTVTKVTIGASVKNIWKEAFSGSFLSQVVFEDPDAIETLADSAFAGTLWLEKQLKEHGYVQIGKHIITVDTYAAEE